ncbi:MAG: undecaprenyl/decaprenyl-phosphate alpha-N-acetylglucosaminyl 1-phosphate transferase [Bacteroides sp.]|nr:undecaprenyl/decaprenyl-phosphate alpha-N-acetylglucosaminyl 1-phosphate transferase [Bacteroides sp.]MBD5285077.1 undecaprenyl/decaprenyl-phosphate alpha-N-acetylglucosaminyl 1-phosphate transferase [Bacteroides sp.]
MTFWIINSISAFLLSVFFSGIMIPQILLIAFKRRLFDEQDPRKIHKGLVPRLGGIAFTPVVCFTISLLLGISSLTGRPYMLDEMIPNATNIAFGFCALFTLYLTGLADDLVGVRYLAKFVVQILCSILLISAGLWFSNLHNLFFINALPWWLGMPLTMIVVVFIINAINLIDGIDGLASGLSFAALIIYGTAFFFMKAYIFAVISFAVVGVLIPFFYYNVFGDAKKRKKIFMGDTGSLTIGLILAYLSLELYCISMVYGSELRANPFIVAFCPLLIPCLDVVRVFMGRIRRHNNPFLPDKTHIHHKLLAIGIPPRLCMVTIVTVALFTSTLNIYLSQYIDVNILVLLDIGGWTAGNILLSKRINKINANSN